MSLFQPSRKVPPGLTLIGSLLLNWKLVSLPVILLGVFKPNFWQAISILLVAPPVSITAVVCLRNHRFAKKQQELGAEFPPLIPTKSLGGLDVLKGLRWEYYFGYIGDYYSGCERPCYIVSTKMFSR